MAFISLRKSDFLKALQNIGWISLGILGLVLFLVLLLGIILGFPSGRIFLSEFAFDQVNERVENIRITYQNVTSPSINKWQIGSLEIYQKDQLWIDIKDLDLSYSLKPILDKEVVVNNISASSVSYYHQQSRADEEQQSNAESNWTESQWRYLIENFQVGRLKLEGILDETAGDQIRELPDYTLQGSVDLFGGIAPVKLDLKAESLPAKEGVNPPVGEHPLMRIEIDSTVNKGSSLTIAGRVVEEAAEAETTSQGLLGRVLQLPVRQEINFEFALDIHKVEAAHSIIVRQLDFPFQQQNIKAKGKILAAFDPLKVQVEEGRIHTGEQLHTVSGTLHGDAVSADISLDQFPLSLISYWVPQIENGRVTTQTEIGGTLKNPEVKTNSKVNVIWKGVNENINATASIKGSYIAKILQLNAFQARIEPDIQKQVQAETLISAQGMWNIQDQVVNMRVEANKLTYDLIKSISKELALPEIPDLEVTVNNANIKLNGSTANQFSRAVVDANINVDAVYQEQPISLTGRANGSLDRLNIHALRIRSSDNQVTAHGLFDLRGPNNALQVDIESIAVDFLRNLDLPVPPDLTGNINGDILFSGAIKNPAVEYSLAADLRYPIPDARDQVSDQNMTFAASGSWKEKSVEVKNLTITYSQFSERDPILDASGQISLTKKIPGMHWKINSNRIPMSLLAPYGWPDNNGELTLDLTVAVPSTDRLDSAWFESVILNGEALYATRLVNPGNRRTTQPVEWSLVLDTQKDKDAPPLWTLNSEVSLPDEETEGNSGTSGVMAVRVQPESLYRFFGNHTQLPEVDVEAELDISSLSFLWPNEHQITGIFKTQLTVTGSVDAPDINGPLTFTKGTYINDALGLYFSDITLDSKADSQSLDIKSITALGRDRGKVSASGKINWREPENDRAVSLDIQAKDFNLVRRRDMEGQVSADLELAGSFNRLVLSGEIDVSPFEVSIAGNPGPEIPEIEYEYAADMEEDIETPQNNGLGTPTLILDLTVTVDQQAYVRGRGLEAELKGNINLQGPVTSLEYQGEFKTLRGEFVVFGKRFELQQGEVGFNNQSTVILVDGLHKEKDTEIRAQLSGTGSDLQLKLTSVPPLPEDEILARLIFGKSAQNISAMQALQLARAVQTLRGGGGGFDPIGSTRDILGVDTLTVDSGESGGVEVGAGKYLSEDVYLELERSTDPAQPWRGNVLIELTPNINLETTTGGSGQQGASARLMWKRDY